MSAVRLRYVYVALMFFFFQAEDGIRDLTVTGVQTCALPISWERTHRLAVFENQISDSSPSFQRAVRCPTFALNSFDTARSRQQKSCQTPYNLAHGFAFHTSMAVQPGRMAYSGGHLVMSRHKKRICRPMRGQYLLRLARVSVRVPDALRRNAAAGPRTPHGGGKKVGTGLGDTTAEWSFPRRRGGMLLPSSRLC